MFLHAEQLPDINTGPVPIPENGALQDNEMIAFIRFGNDFTSNFYQIEVPLKNRVRCLIFVNNSAMAQLLQVRERKYVDEECWYFLHGMASQG